ncbi:hypothetical protein pb186bvf_000567 [Paramecium bursaria]
MHGVCIMTLIMYENPFRQYKQLHPYIFLCFVTITLCLYKTTARNPGYQPIENNQIEIIVQEELIEEKQSNESDQFCNQCRIIRPIRTKHCFVCKRCVAKFDHHCFWLGGCVGELNHRQFVVFLFLQTFVLIWLITYFYEGCGNYEYSKVINGITIYSQEYGTFSILIVLFGFFILFTSGLLIFQLYLIGTGSTSYELNKRHKIKYLKNYPHSFNPFDYGLFRNFKIVFFHGNQLRDWEPLKPPIKEKKSQITNEKEFICC